MDLSIQGESGPRGNPGPQGYPGDKVIVFSVPQHDTAIYDFFKDGDFYQHNLKVGAVTLNFCNKSNIKRTL